MTELLESVTGESGDFGWRGLGPGCESVLSFDVEAGFKADMFGRFQVVQALGSVWNWDEDWGGGKIRLLGGDADLCRLRSGRMDVLVTDQGL